MPVLHRDSIAAPRRVTCGHCPSSSQCHQRYGPSGLQRQSSVTGTVSSESISESDLSESNRYSLSEHPDVRAAVNAGSATFKFQVEPSPKPSRLGGLSARRQASDSDDRRGVDAMVFRVGVEPELPVAFVIAASRPLPVAGQSESPALRIRVGGATISEA
jgi:hypothetical protein